MDAYIVLHGLMLLSCYKTTQNCSILIADTPTHTYTAGFVGRMVALPTPSSSSPAPIILTTDLKASSGTKDPFNSTPVSSAATALKQRSLVLDGAKVTEDRKQAMYAIDIPMPDEIWGAAFVVLDKTKALGNGATDPGLFETALGGSTVVRVPETLILRYKGVSTAFNLAAGSTVITGSGPVKNDTTATANVLILSSWPHCSMAGHPSDTFNMMIKINVGGNTALNLTGTFGFADGDDSGIGSLQLPLSVITPPSCLAPQRQQPRIAETKKAQKSEHQELLNVDPTGCGILSNHGR